MSHLEWQILILDFHWAFLRLRRQRCRGRTKTLLISISPQLHNQENSVVARKSMVVSMGGCRWWESHQYLPWEQTTNFPTIHDHQIQDQLKTISKTVRTKAYTQAWILKIENRICIVYYSSIILLEFYYCEVLYASPPQLRARTSNCVVWVSKSIFVSGS